MGLGAKDPPFMADWCKGSIVDSLSTDLGSTPKSARSIRLLPPRGILWVMPKATNYASFIGRIFIRPFSEEENTGAFQAPDGGFNSPKGHHKKRRKIWDIFIRLPI